MIAAEAGVSHATVSHILGKRLAGRYSEETQARVLEIAEKLNYLPHRGAQAMKSGRSNLIAIVHFGADVEATRKTNLVLSRLTHQSGYDYLAIDMSWYGGSIQRTLSEIIRARAEGVLISHIQKEFQQQHIDELKKFGIPVISVNGVFRDNLPRMSDNLHHAFRDLTGHLMQVGHRRIIQLNSSANALFPEVNTNIRQCIQGFHDSITPEGKWLSLNEKSFFRNWPRLAAEHENGILGITVEQPPELYDNVDQPVYKFCRRLFGQHILPDAIVCRNDLYAMEVIGAGLECGIRVPNDIAVTGYDNDGIGALPAFGITTAEQDSEAICSAAISALLQQMRDPGVEVPSRTFDSKLIIRSSSQHLRA